MISRTAIRTLVAACLAMAASTLIFAQDIAKPQGPLPDSVVTSRHGQLVTRLHDEQGRNDGEADPSRPQRRLDALIQEAAQLASMTETPKPKYDCLSIQLQALYLRINRWPQDVGINDFVAQLRDAARRLKAVRQPDALAAGDFWLVTAELWELKRSTLPVPEQQRQGEQVLRSFIVIHNQGPIVDAARVTLKKLNDSAGPETPVSAGGNGNGNELEAEPARASEIAGDPLYTLGHTSHTREGVTRIPIRCRYQRGENILRILAPQNAPKPGQPVRFLLILPVEAGEGSDFGDPVEVARKLDLANRYNTIVVIPTLSDIPWYADHPTDVKMRQASYITKGVIPALHELFPSEHSTILVLGFSKSGWGALNLLTHNPRDIAAVAVWDAPFALDGMKLPGLQEVFGTPEFLAKQDLGERLRGTARQLRKDKRIALLGYDNFLEQQQQLHKILNDLEIPHDYVEGPNRRHRWDSGWVDSAVEKLVAMSPATAEARANP